MGRVIVDCLWRSFLVITLAILSLAPNFASAQNTTSDTTLPPWEFQTMYWGWNPYNNSLTQCRQLTLQWWQIAGTSPPIKAPYTFTFYLEGHEPYELNVGSGYQVGKNLNYDWTVDLPTGGPYQISLTDANNALGGVGSYLYVEGESPPVSACQPITLVPSALNFTYTGTPAQCNTLQMSVTGGTPPYTFTAVQQDIEPKMITFATGTFDYVLDIGSGRNVTFAVQDSKGLGAVSSQFVVEASTDTSCLTAAPTLQPLAAGLTSVYPGTTRAYAVATGTEAAGGGATGTASFSSSGSHKTPIGAIAGGIAGGIVLLVLAGCFGALLQKRRRSRANRGIGVDLNDADVLTPAGEPVRNPAAAATPYRFSAVSSSARPMTMSEVDGTTPSEADLAALATLGMTQSSAHPGLWEHLGASPPYTLYDSSSSGAGGGGARRNVDTKYEASSSRRSSDVEVKGALVVTNSGVAVPTLASMQRTTSPPLPPGAAAPRVSVGPMMEEFGSQLRVGARSSARSPPPTQ